MKSRVMTHRVFFLHPKKLLFLLSTLLLAAYCVPKQTQYQVKAADPNSVVITYPAPPSAQASTTYSMTVNGQPVFVEEYRHLSYAHFAFAGEANVEVTFNEDVQQYTLSPKSYNIASTASGRVISFNLDRPRKLILHHINDWYHEPDWHNGSERMTEPETEPRLFIFADPLEENPPDPNDPNVIDVVRDYGIDNTGTTDQTANIQSLIDSASSTSSTLYFPPGLYQITYLQMKSNVALYLAGGARLQANDAPYAETGARGTIEFGDIRQGSSGGINNAKIFGRGSIDGNGVYLRFQSGDPPTKLPVIWSYYADNCSIEDVIIRNPSMFTIFLNKSQLWESKNIKVIDYANMDLKTPNDPYPGNDGIDPNNSRHITIDDVFICSGDDNVAIKSEFPADNSRWPVVENIVVKNSVFYNTAWGTSLGIGSEIRGSVTLANITFENIDIISSLFGLTSGTDDYGTPLTENIFYRNIRVEENRWRLIRLQVSSGSARNYNFENVTAANWGPRTSEILGTDIDQRVEDVTFDNFYVGGNLITDISYFITNNYINGITFTSSNPTIVNINATGLYASELDSSPGVFTVSRTGDLSSPVTVNYTIRGIAQNGVDYQSIPDSVTIPAGSSSSTINIVPSDDAENEGLETVFISLENIPHTTDAYIVGPDYHAVVNILDSGGGPPPTNTPTSRPTPTTIPTGTPKISFHYLPLLLLEWKGRKQSVVSCTVR